MHQEVILETHRVDEDDLVCGSRTENENSERIELKRKMVEVCYIIIAYCDRFSFQRSGRAALSLSLSLCSLRLSCLAPPGRHMYIAVRINATTPCVTSFDINFFGRRIFLSSS